MENITKKLLLLKVSLMTAIAIKVEGFKWSARKSEIESIQTPTITEHACVVENPDFVCDLELDSPKESVIERIDRERMEYAREGARGVHLLFTNIKFLGAVLANRTDIISLILEQYYILGKINGATIQSFLDTNYFKFTEEEKVKLTGLINTDSRRVVLT